MGWCECLVIVEVFGAPREDTRSGLRPRSNEARRPFPRKPFGRRVFCPWPALARPSQPAAGMLRSRRLGHSQNPSPQDPTQFPNRLLVGQVDREPYDLIWLTGYGRHFLTVRATDDRGATSSSAPLTIDGFNVPFSTGYQIIAPTNQAVFKAPASVAVVARLTSTDGTEDPIEVFLGTNRVGTINGGPPYSPPLTNLLEDTSGALQSYCGNCIRRLIF